MPQCSPSNWTPGQIWRVVIRVGFLVIPIALAWEHGGPPADRAFWIVMFYFIEIAIWIVVDLIGRVLSK
jgi:hypothetical protein